MWLPEVKKVPSPNTTGRRITTKCIVIHYTAGRSYKSSLSWLTDPASKVSAHFLIGRKGEVAQMVALGRDAWHAGRSQWRSLKSLNRHSIGIELDNHGLLQGSWGEWETWYGERVPDSQVAVLEHPRTQRPAGWHRYTDKQLAALDRLLVRLRSIYQKTPLSVIGHNEIAPTRKLDPGPAFPHFRYHWR